MTRIAPAVSALGRGAGDAHGDGADGGVRAGGGVQVPHAALLPAHGRVQGRVHTDIGSAAYGYRVSCIRT